MECDVKIGNGNSHITKMTTNKTKTTDEWAGRENAEIYNRDSWEEERVGYEQNQVNQ